MVHVASSWLALDLLCCNIRDISKEKTSLFDTTLKVDVMLDLVYTTLKMHLSRRVACHAVIFSHSIGYVPRRKTIFYVFLECRKLLDHGCFCRCERDVLRLSRASHSTGQN